jgi:hypothetical protein
LKPTIGPSPRVAGNTRSAEWRGIVRSTSHAAYDSGRTDSPVFVSASRAVRRVKSISDQRNACASPLRQPVSIVRRRLRIAVPAYAPIVEAMKVGVKL